MERYEIKKVDKRAKPEEKAPLYFESAKDLPESVRKYFDKLSEDIKKKIFPEDVVKEEGRENSEIEAFEDIVATMTEDERENFMKTCFFELFSSTDIWQDFREMKEDVLAKEIYRMADVLWSNRGKRGGDINIFNRSYYDNFNRERAARVSEIKQKEVELERAKAANDKRKTDSADSKIYQRYAELRKELDILKRELDDFDSKNGNDSFSIIRHRGVDGRENKEKKWTEAIAVLEEYLDAEGFVTIFAEQIDSVFRSDIIVSRKKPGDKFFGYEVSERGISRAKEILKIINNAIEKWAEEHREEGAYKSQTDVASSEKIFKLVDYFRRLLRSYKDGKEAGRKDDEMNAEVRLMENTLNLLSRK